MKMKFRILSPAIISACLALPLITSHAQTPAPHILGDKPSNSGRAGDYPKQVAGEYVNPSDPGTLERSAQGPADQMDNGGLGHVAPTSDIIGLEVRNLQ